MNKYWKEKIKLFVLIALVITSIIQVGVLWSPAFFPTNSDNLQKLGANASEKIFVPYRISLSDGFGGHWIIDKRDANYKVLWEDAKYFLTKVMEAFPKQEIDQSQWPDLFGRKSLAFEFESSIDINLSSWFLNTQKVVSNSADGLYKVLIAPWDDIDLNYSTIYINDGMKVYRYNVQMDKLSKEDYGNMISSYQNSRSVSKYGMIGDGSPIRPDVLCATEGLKVIRQFNPIISTIPKMVKGKVSYSSEELLNLAKNVIGDNAYSYDRFVDQDDNTVKFSRVNSIYKIYSDGLLEFTSLQSNSSGTKGNIEEAFKNAYRFLDNCKVLNQDQEIYISGVREEKDRYIFSFNYRIGEYPIFLEYQSSTDDRLLSDAITIEANGNVVLSCDWVLRDFKSTVETNSYNISLRSLFDNETFRSLLRKNKSIMITDILPSYVVSSNKNSQKLSPYWIINATDRNYYIPMEKQTE